MTRSPWRQPVSVQGVWHEEKREMSRAIGAQWFANRGLVQNGFDHIAMNIRKSHIPATIPVGQRFMIHPQ